MGEHGGAKAWILALVIALPTSFGALVGIGCALGANTCPFTDSEPFTSTDGEEIWLANCAICHGLSAAGSEANPDAPSLVEGDLAILTPEELAAKIARGRPLAGMPRFKTVLSAEQIAAVVAYVIELRGGTDE